jgi:pimeloyl-ACP methyl ester carboxylesterase
MKTRIRDIDVNYEEVGSGRPLLILHGGAFGNARLAMGAFEPAFAARSGWRRLYPDLLGHGKTPAPPWIRGIDDVIEVVLEFIDAVIPGQRFAIAGWSWGGYITRGVVYHRLDRIDGVMLNAPGFEWAPGERLVPAKHVIRKDPEFDTALRPGEEWMSAVLTVQTVAMIEDVRRTLSNHASDNPNVKAFDDGERLLNPDVMPEPCLAPTLIVTGRQDMFTGYKQAWSILDNFPRGTYVVLDRAGHFVGSEQPHLFKALANEWLDRVEEYCST